MGEDDDSGGGGARDGPALGNTNHSRLGDLLRVDPERAARWILDEHRTTQGNSSRAALGLRVTYQTLRAIIRRLDGPLPHPSGPDRVVRLPPEEGAEPVTIDEAIAFMRERAQGDGPKLDEEELRRRLEAEVERGGSYAAVAALVELPGGRSLDPAILSRWRSGKGTMSRAALERLAAVLAPRDSRD